MFCIFPIATLPNRAHIGRINPAPLWGHRTKAKPMPVSPKNPVFAAQPEQRGALISLAFAIDVYGMRNGNPAGIRAARKRLTMAFKAKTEATVHRNLLMAKAEFRRAVTNASNRRAFV